MGNACSPSWSRTDKSKKVNILAAIWIAACLQTDPASEKAGENIQRFDLCVKFFYKVS